jgi:arginine decarboxylase
LCQDGSYRIYGHHQGDNVDSVLRAVDFDVRELVEIYRQRVNASQFDDVIKQGYLEELEAGLSGYTYLED